MSIGMLAMFYNIIFFNVLIWRKVLDQGGLFAHDRSKVRFGSGGIIGGL